MNTAVRQGLRMDLPDKSPSRFKATKNSGRTKAIPKISINLNTKSRYSSNLTRLPRLSGVNPSNTSTACGKIKYAKTVPVANSGVAITENNIATLFSLRCNAGVIKDHN